MELAKQSRPTRRRPDGSLQRLGARVLVVFGGTGFVGSAVLSVALSTDPQLQVVVVSRTGAPPAYFCNHPILQSKRLLFVAGNLLQPESVQRALLPWTIEPQIHFVGCISCVGCITPWNQQQMVETCGDANICAYQIYRALPGSGIKFVVITRDRTNWSDWWYPFPYILPGYYEGKRKIETFIWNDEENRGNAVCLRAGFVVGTRRTIPGLSTRIPVYVPLHCPCRVMGLFSPTVDVDELGAAAVRFALAPKERKADATLIENEKIPEFFI
jgi:hypothetical protein